MKIRVLDKGTEGFGLYRADMPSKRDERRVRDPVSGIVGGQIVQKNVTRNGTEKSRMQP